MYMENIDEMMKKIVSGDNIRNTNRTVFNDVSSRSHSVCEIHLRKKNVNLSRKIVIIDLAGSERANSSIENSKIRQHEGSEINKSLL